MIVDFLVCGYQGVFGHVIDSFISFVEAVNPILRFLMECCGCGKFVIGNGLPWYIVRSYGRFLG